MDADDELRVGLDLGALAEIDRLRALLAAA